MKINDAMAKEVSGIDDAPLWLTRDVG